MDPVLFGFMDLIGFRPGSENPAVFPFARSLYSTNHPSIPFIMAEGPEDMDSEVEECVRRIAGPKERPFFRELLKSLVRNNSIPIRALRELPVPTREAGKTRFDQLYAAAMNLVFPDYRENTIVRLLGDSENTDGIRIWRCIFPERFKLTHVLIRARTYQQAFALAADYACRASLYMFGKIPPDLTVRVMFMSESALRRHLTLREANRKSKRRKQLLLEAREYTPRQVSGARLAALGPPDDPSYSIFRYVEKQDLRRLKEVGKARVSSVESEGHRSRARR